MGAGASFEQNLQNKTQKIKSYHDQVNILTEQISQKSEKIKATIVARGYTDKNAVCSRIIWQNYDELSSFFPVVKVDNVKYKAGMKPQSLPDELRESKLQTCLDITTLYAKKINLINYILSELPKCIEAENSIYNDLFRKLKTENANNEKWLSIYEKMEKFNKTIVNRYQLIYKQLDEIRFARTISQMDGVANTTFAIVSKTTTACKTMESDLIIYSNRNAAANPVGNALPVPSKPIPAPPLE
jgi:hypothetical protein